MQNEKVIKVNGNPDASNTVTTIPPGFLPMPTMVTIPILGHTAHIQPITAKGKDVVSACTGGCKNKPPQQSRGRE